MPVSTGFSAGRVRSAYTFIKAYREDYSVEAMCRVLEVATSGYDEWLIQPISRRAQEDTSSSDPSVVRREPGHLWRPSCLIGLA